MRRMHSCLLLLRRPSVESSSSSSSSFSSLTYCTLKQQQSDRSRYRRLSSLSLSPPTTTSFTNSKCRVIYTAKTRIFSSVLRLKKIYRETPSSPNRTNFTTFSSPTAATAVNSTSHLKRISKAQFMSVTKRATHYNIYRSSGSCTFLLCWFLSLMKIYFGRVSVRVLICQDATLNKCGARRLWGTTRQVRRDNNLTLSERLAFVDSNSNTLYIVSVCVCLVSFYVFLFFEIDKEGG